MRSQIPFQLAGIVGLILATENAWSIGGAGLPGAALPEQVSRSLSEEQTTPQTAGTPTLAAPQEKKTSPLGPQAEKIKFKLNGVVLEGNHAYSRKDLSLIYKKQIGKVISVADLFNIVQGITNYYRNSGYVISRAILPPQHVKNGVVHIRILEGYIGEVNISGKPKGAKCIALKYGKKIKSCPPLELKHMEKYLLLANEVPGTQVKAILAPSKKRVGAADLTLMTDNKPLTGYLSYDNYGTRYIGPQQMTGNLGVNSIFISGDTTQLTLTKTPKGGELSYTDLNYNVPLGDNGVRWLVGGTYAHTHPLFVLQPLEIDGVTNNYYTTFSFPLLRSRTESLTTRAGFNYLDSQVNALGEQLYTDHIRSLDIGITYNFTDRWYGANLISSDLRKGLPITGYTSNVDPNTAQTSRPGGRGTYTKVIGQVSRLQAIKGPLSLYALASGQWAFNPLLASEQFTFGGPQLGRGYDVAEILGDKGAAGSLELRYDLVINRAFIQNLQPYIFYDIGAIWNKEVNFSSPSKMSASSFGFGARFFSTHYLSGNIMWAQPLTKQVAAEELIDDGWRPRVFFSLVASFD